MAEYPETPEMVEMVERLHGRPFLPSQTEHEWRLEVVVLLRGIFECLASAPWMTAVSSELSVSSESLAAFHEVPVRAEPGAVSGELSVQDEPLPTWILTDEQVSRVEGAVEQEQRVRGRAYGG